MGFSTRVILRAISNAMTRQRESKQPVVNFSASHLDRMAVSTLEASRTEWNTREYVIPSETLSLYYEISVLLRPLPHGPNLEPTWSAAWKAVKDQAEAKSCNLVAWDLAMFEWLDLSKAIQENEPRFLRQTGFPEMCIDAVRKFMDCVAQVASGESSFGSPGEYSSEIGHLESLELTIEQIRFVFPFLEVRAEEIEGSIASEKDRLENDRDEQFAEPPDDYEPREPSSSPSGGFDIDEVFEDL